MIAEGEVMANKESNKSGGATGCLFFAIPFLFTCLFVSLFPVDDGKFSYFMIVLFASFVVFIIWINHKTKMKRMD
jgi:Ca2+/Na+ antiporter